MNCDLKSNEYNNQISTMLCSFSLQTNQKKSKISRRKNQKHRRKKSQRGLKIAIYRKKI